MCSKRWYKHSISHSDPCCHGDHLLLLLFPQDPLAVTADLPGTASRTGEQWETVYSATRIHADVLLLIDVIKAQKS